MTETTPRRRRNNYQSPPMQPKQALAIAKYSLLSAIADERAQGETAALPDLIAASVVIDKLKDNYANQETPPDEL